MDLVEVDVVEPEPSERCVDRREDVLAAQPRAVLAGHRAPVHLRREDVLLARPEEPAQNAPRDHLALALVVDVGRVEEDDAALDRPAHDRLGLVLADRPPALRARAEAHHSEADARDAQPRSAEVHVVHGGTLDVQRV
jgi:hypothetical protein